MAIPNIWRTKKQRYSLEGTVCPTCNTTMFPPRQQCLQCSHLSPAASAPATGDPYNYFMIFDLSQSAKTVLAGDD